MKLEGICRIKKEKCGLAPASVKYCTDCRYWQDWESRNNVIYNSTVTHIEFEPNNFQKVKE